MTVSWQLLVKANTIAAAVPAIQAFFMMTYKPSELGQTDLVIGLCLEFISK